jgi:hypothetical protein
MKITLASFVFFSAASAFASPPPRALPELEAKGIRGIDGSCDVLARETTVLTPEVDTDPRAPESWRREARDAVRLARARLARAKRDLDRIQDGVDTVVMETNECGDPLWERLSVLASTGEAAARDEAGAPLALFATGGRETWTARPLASLASDEAAAKPLGSDRYADACRAPDVDAELYSPSSSSLTPEARSKLEEIAGPAARVSAALRAQKKALDELLTLIAGRRCREILSAFDSLVRAERQSFFDYREKAVAGAIWGELRWEKSPPAP